VGQKGLLNYFQKCRGMDSRLIKYLLGKKKDRRLGEGARTEVVITCHAVGKNRLAKGSGTTVEIQSVRGIAKGRGTITS